MNNNIFVIFLVFFFPFFSLGQKYDYNWMFGYDGNVNDERFGIFKINFNQNPVLLERQNDTLMDIYISNATMSDNLGNLLFYTNGCYIADKTHQMMLNGDNINPGIVHDNTCHVFGYSAGTQSCLTLPHPKEANFYYLFHKLIEYHSVFGILNSRLFYTLIDMNLNEGLGGVVEKNISIIADTLSYSELTSVKHANGRDWWIIIPQRTNNRYYRILLDADGIGTPEEQIVGDTISSGSGHAAFSPNGEKYIRYTPEEQITVFDFNRSTGLLSNPQNVSFDTPPPSFGDVEVSPNSRFLYLSNTKWLMQFDLEAADIDESMVVIDTFDGFESPFPTQFFQAQLAPDCKIYINSFNGSDVLHVINKPDRKGMACDFQQHAIDLPTFHGISMPHFPNYRLGTTPTYPCDSTIVLTEISNILPPIYSFKVYPNPFQNKVQLECPACPTKTLKMSLYNTLGQMIFQKKFFFDRERVTIYTKDLENGIYFYNLEEEGKVLGSGKLIKS